jgi:two-component system, OmpR family, sensor kinase
MSLRLRLTIIFTTLLSSAVILLSIVIYSIVSVVMLNQIDTMLEQRAGELIDAFKYDSTNRLYFSVEDYWRGGSIVYQVWSLDQQLLLSSSEDLELNVALDADSFGLNHPIFRETEYEQVNYRVLTIPLLVDETEGGWLQIGYDMVGLRAARQMFQLVFGLSSLFVIIISAIIGWLITGQALSPLVEMAHITKRITDTNDLSRRIPVSASRNDEINELVLTFNQTLVRLERLFNAQKRFLADVSHELRTPLTVIKGNVGLMRMMNTIDEESLNSIESEVDRLTRLVGDLLLMAQAESGQLPMVFSPVELDDLVYEVCEQMRVLSGGEHEIQVNEIEPAIVMGDRDRLKQVLLNLGSNAIKFTPPGKCIRLGIKTQQHWAQIFVSDEGIGIPEEERAQLFERFYRGDKARSRSQQKVGFGLGLPIAYWIVNSHHGRIDVDTKPDIGTTFTVWLPLSQREIPTRPLRPKKGLS